MHVSHYLYQYMYIHTYTSLSLSLSPLRNFGAIMGASSEALIRNDQVVFNFCSCTICLVTCIARPLDFRWLLWENKSTLETRASAVCSRHVFYVFATSGKADLAHCVETTDVAIQLLQN